MEGKLFFPEEKLSAFQSQNKSMHTSGNDFLKEKISLKEYNIVLADKIINLNGYIIQLWSSSPFDNNANTQHVGSTPHRE